MAKGKALGLVLGIVALAILGTMFIANLGEMRSDYSENTTFAQTGERAFGLFNMLTSFIVPLALIVVVVIIFLFIKWAFSQVGGNY